MPRPPARIIRLRVFHGGFTGRKETRSYFSTPMDNKHCSMKQNPKRRILYMRSKAALTVSNVTNTNQWSNHLSS